MKKSLLLILTLPILLAACSSGVKLSDVPVQDMSGAQPVVEQQKPAPSASSAVAAVKVEPLKAASDPSQVAGFKTVYFDFDSYDIKAEAKPVIEAHARHLRDKPGHRVALEGHTDERGGREYNLALGQKRAEAVRKALTVLGVPDGQIEAVSFGKEKPADSGRTEVAHGKNRRVEFRYK